MKELFLSLAEKCFDNDLQFDYSPNVGSIYVWDKIDGISDPVGRAYTKSYVRSPEEELTELHDLVDSAIEEKEESA